MKTQNSSHFILIHRLLNFEQNSIWNVITLTPRFEESVFGPFSSTEENKVPKKQSIFSDQSLDTLLSNESIWFPSGIDEAVLELTSPLRTLPKRYVKNLPFFEVEFIRVYSNNIFWKSLIQKKGVQGIKLIVGVSLPQELFSEISNSIYFMDHRLDTQ